MQTYYKFSPIAYQEFLEEGINKGIVLQERHEKNEQTIRNIVDEFKKGVDEADALDEIRKNNFDEVTRLNNEVIKLEAELEQAKTDLITTRKRQSTSNPTSRFNKAVRTAGMDALAEMKKSFQQLNTFNIAMFEQAVKVAAMYIEGGTLDFNEYMNKVEAQLGKKAAKEYEEELKEAFKKYKTDAIANGFFTEQDFQSDEDIEKVYEARQIEAENKVAEIKAKRDAALAKAREAASKKRAENPAKEKEQESAAEKLAKRLIDRVKDKKLEENDVEALMLKELLKKGSELVPKGMNPNKPLTPLERIKEAIKNYDTYKQVWIEAQGEVEAKIEEMELSEMEKEILKSKLSDFVENKIKYPFSKESASKYAREVAQNKTISALFDMYDKMGVNIESAKDEIIDKIAFTLGIEGNALEAFKEDLEKRFNEIASQKADAKAKREARKEALAEAAKIAKGLIKYLRKTS